MKRYTRSTRAAVGDHVALIDPRNSKDQRVTDYGEVIQILFGPNWPGMLRVAILSGNAQVGLRKTDAVAYVMENEARIALVSRHSSQRTLAFAE